MLIGDDTFSRLRYLSITASWGEIELDKVVFRLRLSALARFLNDFGPHLGTDFFFRRQEAWVCVLDLALEIPAGDLGVPSYCSIYPYHQIV